ncbi:MAG TPA: hypothetical protein VKQ70_04930, partial [Caulobacteraceae bacterium]|nr:hypothetical protein [Caulobacteraceae bacterium]
MSALELLISGGDERIALDGPTGLNRYGCQPFPDPGSLAFGSSTASVISVGAFAEVERFAKGLGPALDAGRSVRDLYAAEAERVRRDLTALLGLDGLAGLKTVIAPSGTDLHHLVAQVAGAGVAAPPLVIASEASETGSGVGAALGGLTSSGAALRAHVAAAGALAAPSPCQVLHAPSRAPDGSVRPIEQV